MGFSKLSYINVHDKIKKFDKFSGNSHFSMASSGEPAAKKAKKVYKVKFADSRTKRFPIRRVNDNLHDFTVYHARSQFPVHMWE